MFRSMNCSHHTYIKNCLQECKTTFEGAKNFYSIEGQPICGPCAGTVKCAFYSLKGLFLETEIRVQLRKTVCPFFSTNEKVRNSRVLSIDQSPFKVFTPRVSSKSVEAPFLRVTKTRNDNCMVCTGLHCPVLQCPVLHCPVLQCPRFSCTGLVFVFAGDLLAFSNLLIFGKLHKDKGHMTTIRQRHSR